MNLNKSREFFDPELLDAPIHIIGCGAVGSTIAENLARLGIKELNIWDFDDVEEHNIANQMFFQHQVNKPKTEAVESICKLINPEISIIKHERYTDESLSGYVFICPDSIKVRRRILEANFGNSNILGVFGRVLLQIRNLISSNMSLTTTADFRETRRLSSQNPKKLLSTWKKNLKASMETG